MKKIFIILLILTATLAAIFILFKIFKSPDLSEYEHLKEPKISKKANEKVIEVRSNYIEYTLKINNN